jgi:hypothetical protein
MEMLRDESIPEDMKAKARNRWLADHPGCPPPWEEDAKGSLPPPDTQPAPKEVPA